ncbi:hypothetical protein M3Y94_00658700 [Aphelenchoides besseyi]|nr:hypothetical protein M3Y94_00658700 [Aphelenchoides besseyi]KAI6231224.1 hypothetical protein M3Y95_00358700 [Aphelenchoides besseyi]
MNTTVDIEYAYVGKFWSPSCCSRSPIDGRFLMSFDATNLQIIDLFHSRSRKLQFDFSFATSKGKSLKISGKFDIEDVFPLNLETMIVMLLVTEDNVNRTYIGTAKIDFSNWTVFIRQILSFNELMYSFNWIPLSTPPNLTDGLILCFTDALESLHSLVLKIGTDGKLKATEWRLPGIHVFAFHDGYVYGHTRTAETHDQLVKIPFPVDRQTETSIERLCSFNVCSLFGWDTMCCIGQIVYILRYDSVENKSVMFSMDMNTRDWRPTGLVLDGQVDLMITDKKRTLIIRMYDDNPFSLSKYYRFTINEPDSLAYLTWLRLKRMFDVRPSSYQFILSRLPSNYKPKCPFSVTN